MLPRVLCLCQRPPELEQDQADLPWLSPGCSELAEQLAELLPEDLLAARPVQNQSQYPAL